MSFQDFYRLSSHAVIVNQYNQVLLLKATYTDCAWGLPGGALDVGETIHQAVKRECFEELGCHVQIAYLSCVYFHSAVTSHAFIFKCTLAEDAQIQISSEHSAFKWFNVEDLSPVQKQRVEDCLNFDGHVHSRSF